MAMIRVMDISDYEQIYNLWINTPGMGLNNIDDSKEGIASYLKRNPKTCFVALDNNKVIGVIIAGHDGRRGYIYHTAVHLDYRKQGIGNDLVNHSMQALECEGITKVGLVVFERNELGNSFWEKRGFKEREDLVYRNKCIKLLERIDT